MKNKGFTIVELLAVMVLLAFIALIAVPIIRNLINDSKAKTTSVNATKYIESVKLELTNRKLDNAKYVSSCTVKGDKTGTLLCDDNTTIEVEIEGKAPNSGQFYLDDMDVLSATLQFDEYNYFYTGDKVLEVDKDEIYTITFDYDGGTEGPKTKQVLYGKNYGELPLANKDGKKFLGWTNGVNLMPDLSLWTLSGGAEYDPVENSIYLPDANSKAVSPLIYVGDTNINTLKYFKIYAYFKGVSETSEYLMLHTYFSSENFAYSGNGIARAITPSWQRYDASIRGSYISKGTCSHLQIIIKRDSASTYALEPYYFKNVDLRVQNETIDAYEPYFTTSSTKVNVRGNHTLKAVYK